MGELTFDILYPEKTSFKWPAGKSIFEDYQIIAYCNKEKAGSLTMVILKEDNSNIKNSKGKVFWYNTSIPPFYISKDENLKRPMIINRQTEEKFRNKGLQRKLIISANDFAKEFFKNPLHSDITFKEEYREILLKTWENLVKDKLAFKYDINGDTRYGMY